MSVSYRYSRAKCHDPRAKYKKDFYGVHFEFSQRTKKDPGKKD